MGSKAFVLLGLLLAFVLLTASEVTARDMAETSTSEEITEEAKNTNGVEQSKYHGGSFGGNNRGGFGGNNGGGFGGNNGGGFGGNNGGGFGGNNGGGFGGNNGGGFGGNNGGGFGGNNGGGFGGNNGRGGRGNRGGRYGGGYCRYRCCRRNYYGGCYRCCSYLGEAMDKQIEGQTHN